MDEAEVLCDRVAVMDHGKIIVMDPPRALISALLARGFTKPVIQQQATLEDVFLDLTGHELRED
jgi:ABC-2 type transport system ATP-binding protein